MDSGSGGRLPRARLLPHSPLLQRSASTASTGLGGEGLPQTTPLLSRRGCKWGSNPLSSMIPLLHTFHVLPPNHPGTHKQREKLPYAAYSASSAHYNMSTCTTGTPQYYFCTLISILFISFYI